MNMADSEGKETPRGKLKHTGTVALLWSLQCGIFQKKAMNLQFNYKNNYMKLGF